MFFAKLLPHDGDFFKLFNEHAEHTLEAARALSKMVSHYDDPLLQ